MIVFVRMKISTVALLMVLIAGASSSNFRSFGEFHIASPEVEGRDSREYSSADCYNDLSLIFNIVGGNSSDASWAWQMIDSSGKIPDGLLYGASYNPGMVYECMSTTFPSGELQPGFTSYCMVRLEADPEAGLNNTDLTSLNISSVFPPGTTLENGFCVPESCANPPENLHQALTNLLADSNVVGLSVTVKNCHDDLDYNSSLDPYQVIILAIVAFFGALVLFGTICLEWYKLHHPNDPQAKTTSRGFQTVAAFSAVTNTKALLNTEATKDTITCMNGIRLFSMFWVFFGHSFSNNFLSNIYNNPQYFIDFLKSPFYLILYNGNASVDSFFVLSSVLVTYLLLKEMSKKNGKFNVVQYYLHRYIRLTPLYAINLALLVAVFPMLSDSPKQHEDLGKEFLQRECTYWWANLLYIHNLFWNERYNLGFCLDHGWYVAVDMQFYVFAPLIIVPLYFLSKKNKWLPHVWMFLWVSSSIITHVSLMLVYRKIDGRNSPNGMFGVDINNGNYGFVNDIKPYMRYHPFVCGIWTGYILYQLRGKKLKLPMWVAGLLWCGVFTVMSLVIFGPAHCFVLNDDDVSGMCSLSRAESLWYTVLFHPSWAIAICTMIVLCHHGYGGPINVFLSFKGFVPVSRLVYGVYLVHVPLMFWYWYTRITPFTIDHTTKVFDFLGHLGVTLCVTFVLSMMFEFPILRLERIWLFPAPRQPKTVPFGKPQVADQELEEVEGPLAQTLDARK